ncbi:hypothetical protein DMUE_1180 [Dictyocoela muelleri]|nr:hypothetical protein DMUE_1180 [Dictyocoela muelleri]
MRELSKCESIWLKWCMKIHYLTTNELPRDIINIYVNPNNVGVVSKLNKYQDLMDSITRHRKVANLNSSDIEYDINPDNFMTRAGESFILYDSVTFGPERYSLGGG